MLASAENNNILQFVFLVVLLWICVVFVILLITFHRLSPLHFGVFVFLLVSLVLSCICISISMGDGWMHPECWFTDAICSCGKWSVSNSDREKRRKRSKRKENYFLFRSSYHSVPRILSVSRPYFFRKFLGPLKSYKNGSVFKTCIWISVFRRKKR